MLARMGDGRENVLMPSQAHYRTQHVGQTPRGWKVRTTLSGRHRLRVAYPPGARRKGTGKVVEILHPKGENPCDVTPAAAQKTADKMPPVPGRGKHKNRRRNSPELVILGATGNPKSKKRKKRLNPDEMQEATELYTMFHGSTPKEILEIQQNEEARKTYAGLGDLLSLIVLTPGSGKVDEVEIAFGRKDDVLLASSPDGKQLYLIGGNQNLNGSLEQFGVDTSKDLVDLGEAKQITYHAAKYFDGYEPIDYVHDFGEETGVLPRLFYNKLQKRLALVGGAYKVELDNLVEGMSPGIVN